MAKNNIAYTTEVALPLRSSSLCHAISILFGVYSFPLPQNKSTLISLSVYNIIASSMLLL